MRHHEGADHIAAERAAIECACNRWHMHAAKLPIKYRLDYLLSHEGRARAWAEVKSRTTPHDAYPSYLIALDKLISARALYRETGLRFLLLVQFSDGLFYWVDEMAPLRVDVGGRTDRGDPQDIEPVVLIPMNQFRALAP